MIFISELESADVLETVDIVTRAQALVFKFLGQHVEKLGVVLDRYIVVRLCLRILLLHISLCILLREKQFATFDLREHAIVDLWLFFSLPEI